MMLDPEGEATLNYQSKLINKLGVVEVMRMQSERRNINKLSVEFLKEVIEKYKTK